MMLTEIQIDQLELEIRKRGVTEDALAAELLDHFCCSVEEKMTLGKPFDDAFNLAYLEICPDGLREINWDEKIIQLTYKRSVMKKFVFIFGFAATFIFAVGFAFKVMHWPGANIMIMTGGFLFTILFLPLYFMLKYKAEKDLGVEKPVFNYVAQAAMMMMVCFTAPYKFMNWPYAAGLGLIGLGILTLGILPRVFLNWYKNFGNTPPASQA